MNQQQGQSQLQNIFSRSFPANNLIEISLVKDTNPELAFYKNRYFFFLSLTPGMKTDQGGRTFNREGRITIKTEAEKLLALSHSMKAFARGQGQQFGQFAIFVDSSKTSFGGGGGIKTCFISEYNQEQQNNITKRNVVLSFKTGQNKPVGNFWSPVEAMAISDIMEFMSKKCFKLEFEARSQAPMGTGGQQSGGQNTQNYYQSPSPQNQGGGRNQNFNPPNQGQGGGNQNFNPNQGYQQNTAQNVTNTVQNAMMGNQGGNSNPIPDEDIPF